MGGQTETVSDIPDAAAGGSPDPSPPAATETGIPVRVVHSDYGALPLPLILVLAALAFAAWRQGAYYGHQFATVELVVGVAATAASARAIFSARRRYRQAEAWPRELQVDLPGPNLDRADLHAIDWHNVARWSPVPVLAAASGLAATTAVSGLLHHQLRAAAPTFGILASTAVVASMIAIASDKAKQTLLAGLVGVGVLVAVTGWWGVAAHRWPWSLVDGGLWRAASSLTYANATAAVCVPLALLALSQLAVRRSPGWSLAAMVLLAGAAATLSRAGALAFAVGLVILVSVHGIVHLVRVVWPAVLGAMLATAGLAGSFSAARNGAATSGGLGVASAMAAAGMVLAFAGAAYLPHLGGRRFPGTNRVALSHTDRNGTDACSRRGAGTAGSYRRRWLVLALLAVAAVGLVGSAGPAVRQDRLSVQSPDRISAWRATWDLARAHAWIGVGPGSFAASWRAADGQVMTAQYTHNEYLQLSAQQGVLGVDAMTLGLGAIAWAVWRRRPPRRGGEMTADFSRWAGVVAALSALGVQSAFDFLWHIPLIPLMGAALVGMVLAHPTTEVPR